MNSIVGGATSTSVKEIERAPRHSISKKSEALPNPQQKESSPKARILVVEDNSFVRESLVSLIDGQADLLCCGEADSVASTPGAVRRCKPDLVLTDLRFKDGEAFELINSLALGAAKPTILVLSQLDELLYAERALQAGARGYVMKAEAANELLIAIRAVLRGRVYLSPAMSTRLVQRVLKPGLKTAEVEKRSRTP